MDACKVLLSCCLKVHWHIRRHLPIAPIIRRAALRQYKSSLKNPDPKKLTNSSSTTPYVFLGNDAFALKTCLMKPYSQKGLTVEKRIYNYKHGRARGISENLFGIICNRWRFFRAPILLLPNSVERIVLAMLVLHNLLRRSSSRSTYCPPGLTDMELPT